MNCVSVLLRWTSTEVWNWLSSCNVDTYDDTVSIYVYTTYFCTPINKSNFRLYMCVCMWRQKENLACTFHPLIEFANVNYFALIKSIWGQNSSAKISFPFVLIHIVLFKISFFDIVVSACAFTSAPMQPSSRMCLCIEYRGY